MNMIIDKAKEVQEVAAKLLYGEQGMPFTDVEEWNRMQVFLSKSLEKLVRKEGSTPEEEAEVALAILMGYTVAIRKPQQIDLALARAERSFPLLADGLLKCKLAVFCYLECRDEELLETAHRLLEELKQTSPTESLNVLENFLLSMEEQ